MKYIFLLAIIFVSGCYRYNRVIYQDNNSKLIQHNIVKYEYKY